MTKGFVNSLQQAQKKYINSQVDVVVESNKTSNLMNEVFGKIRKAANKIDRVYQRTKNSGDALGSMAREYKPKEKEPEQQDPNSIFAPLPGNNQQTQTQNQDTSTQQNQNSGRPTEDVEDEWEEYLEPGWSKMDTETRSFFDDDFRKFVQYKMKEANLKKAGAKL